VRWLADECIDAGLVLYLRATGHDVIYAAEITPAIIDAEIVTRAKAEDRLLLTEDKDFGNLVFRQRRSIPGVILLRIDPARHELKKRRLRAAIDRLGEKLHGRYTVVDEARIRTRPLPVLLAALSDLSAEASDRRRRKRSPRGLL
jgi:predicted nuclease of predicted toxin-antitoxin system